MGIAIAILVLGLLGWAAWPMLRPSKPVVLEGFTGFSRDGNKFAWVSRSNIQPEVQCLFVIESGKEEARSLPLDLFAEKATQQLKDGGFTRESPPWPENFIVKANIYAQQPTVTVWEKTSSKETVHVLGQAPYPRSDDWEVWGINAAGTHVAIHIWGPPVNGLFTKAVGGTLHFYHVVPLR